MPNPFEKVKESLADAISSIEQVGPRRLVAKAEIKNVIVIFEKLLNDFREDFYIDFIAVIDYLEEKQFEVNYSVWIYSLKTMLSIKFRLSRENPTIDTISNIIPSATIHEQEAYDLMGIFFSGNPKLKRGFFVTEEIKDGFPLRKDWVKQI